MAIIIIIAIAIRCRTVERIREIKDKVNVAEIQNLINLIV